MNKLDKDFKKEVDDSIDEGSYIVWKVGIRILLVIIVISVLSVFGNVFIKKYKTEKNREIFKKSVTYTESACSFLSDCLKQYNEAKTEVEKKTIMEYVTMRYPNLDLEDIDNELLRQFYRKCVLGGN